jgi:hypothetical protein
MGARKKPWASWVNAGFRGLLPAKVIKLRFGGDHFDRKENRQCVRKELGSGPFFWGPATGTLVFRQAAPGQGIGGGMDSSKRGSPGKGLRE